MKSYSQRLLICLFICFAQSVFAGGLSSWSQETPYGNELWYECTGENEWITLIYRGDFDGSNVDHVKEWYFYKGHIIGKLDQGRSLGDKYFIFNDADGYAVGFSSETAFEKALAQKGLKPSIWTRWYNTHWGVLYKDVSCFLCCTEAFFLDFFIICTLLFLLVKLIRKKGRSRKHYLWITCAFVAVVIIRVLLDIYPQSF